MKSPLGISRDRFSSPMDESLLWTIFVGATQDEKLRVLIDLNKIKNFPVPGESFSTEFSNISLVLFYHKPKISSRMDLK